MASSGKSRKETASNLGKLLKDDFDPFVDCDIPLVGKRYVQNDINAVWVYDHETADGHLLKHVEGDKPDLDEASLDGRYYGGPIFFVDLQGQWWAGCRTFDPSEGFIDILETYFSQDEDEPFLTPQIPRSFALAPY